MFNFILNEKKYKKIHFIGIGGVSMSGIAMLINAQGYDVSGSDMGDSEVLTVLKEKGIKVFNKQVKENITDQDLFVYTDAIPEYNEELVKAKETGNPVITRGVFLGALMKNYDKAIAVSGSHGKSTTTSMIAKILLSTEKEPSILLGGDLDEMDGNVNIGKEDILLTEACEFKGNILNFYPTTAIVLNIDADHLDYFKDLNHIVDTFIGYMKNLDENSKAIINIDNTNTHKLLDYIPGEVITFGIENKNADYHIKSLEFDKNGHPKFTLRMKNGMVEDFQLQIIGVHNVYNSIAAIIASYENGIDIGIIKSALREYTALHRRFETIGEYNGAKVITDYAHHPVEIDTTLRAAKSFTDKNIITVFEPHQYSRTLSFLNEFSQAFSSADEVIITDIYSAREEFNPNIHSRDLVEKIVKNGVNAKYISDFETVKKDLQKRITSDDIVITIGAGKPHILAKMLIK